MDSNGLRNALARLHDELARTPRVDASSRELLRKLADDIARLDQKPAAPSAADSHPSRLKELEAKFEAEHPALAETLREVIDALGKSGL